MNKEILTYINNKKKKNKQPQIINIRKNAKSERPCLTHFKRTLHKNIKTFKHKKVDLKLRSSKSFGGWGRESGVG